ncbi:MAG TPA: hypothetical protein VHB02_08680, partial [Acidimicrobiales bacterium]|nr:hypothetical protein [Acidimicrobiales bacterium]
MATFMVGYDLKKDQDYAPLINKLKSYTYWWHYLDSTWIVAANSTAVAVRNELRPLIKADDRLLVVNVTSDGWAAQLPDKALLWLRARADRSNQSDPVVARSSSFTINKMATTKASWASRWHWRRSVLRRS